MRLVNWEKKFDLGYVITLSWILIGGICTFSSKSTATIKIIGYLLTFTGFIAYLIVDWRRYKESLKPHKEVVNKIIIIKRGWLFLYMLLPILTIIAIAIMTKSLTHVLLSLYGLFILSHLWRLFNN